ncbi:MAG: hypothetical protein DRI69_02680 [Bacteroidetes bacterium]|nr:MAG: hypothetical protein DRI69_02680 [Bacteroidota bacterium]
MKKLIFLTIAVFGMASAYAQSDAISKYFDKYMEDERFDMVYISPKMFELFASMNIEGEDAQGEIMDIVKDLKGLRVLSFEGDENSADEALGFYKEAKGRIDLDSYEELIVARDGDENVHIMVKSEGDIVSELFVLIGGGNEFTMLSFVGNIDLKKVGKIARMLDIDAMDHLEHVDEK